MTVSVLITYYQHGELREEDHVSGSFHGNPDGGLPRGCNRGGAVTVYNPARIPVGVLVDGESREVQSGGIMSIDITEAEQKINITSLTGGNIMGIDVNDRDIIVLLPEAFVGNAPASVRVVPVPGDFDFSLADESLAQP